MATASYKPAPEAADAQVHADLSTLNNVSTTILPTTETNLPNDITHPSNHVLTPPTSEDLNKNHGATASLSEDEDDDWELEPDHYWDGGKIPVFKPTMKQFRDFEKCIEKIDKYGMKSGIVKVIPPAEWRDSQPDLSLAVKQIRVKNPITQEFHGTYGTYTQANIEKQRSYNLPQWKGLTQESNHQPPARRGERRRAPDIIAKPRAMRQATNTATSDAATNGVKRGRGRPRKNPLPEEITEPCKAEEEEQENVPPTPVSPLTQSDAAVVVKDELVESIEVKPVKRKPGRPPRSASGRASAKPKGPRAKSAPKPKGDTKTSVSARRLNNRTDTFQIDEAAFQGFDYRMSDLDQFTPERCKELEDVYWKTINYGTPMYGADMPGSLFDDRTQCWNVAKLPNLLDALGTKVPGVNTAYLYLGMWKATFAWHLEDVDLYSINYIHFGAPKQWYSISQEDARRFEAAMKTLWPNDAKHCDQFLRHKTYLISPEKLKSQFNITVNKLVHYEGEFVITYPYGYHSGFNVGYNCAESVNFANESWLNYGRIAKKCECESDSVWVDVFEIERKLRGEPTPEYYEVTDDDEDGNHLPSPPPSESAKRGRKRKRDQAETPKKKKIKIRIRAAAVEPCVLCPNDVIYDQLLPTDNGKMAHRLCALYTPETFLVEENGVERVCNVAGISKARLELRCMHCRSKKGSCFQCSSKKCHRAFHATCAASAGVQIDTGLVPTWDEDGTEYYCEGYDFRCRFHRPKRPKFADSDSLEKNALTITFGADLKPGVAVQAQGLDGDIFAGVVVSNQAGERSCIIDVVSDGDRIEIEWKYLLVLDPADSLRPKPSHDAKALPAHLLRKPADVSSSNRKDGVPSEGDPFMDPMAGQKWAEFHTATSLEIRNPAQAKINLDIPDQLWHYLGCSSTEAKPQYTHDVRVSVNNPRSNFLDTVRSSLAPSSAARSVQLARRNSSLSAGNGQNTTPRSDGKAYSYKPRASMAPHGQPHYGPHLPWQQGQAANARTITPQQLHYNYGNNIASNATAAPQHPQTNTWRTVPTIEKTEQPIKPPQTPSAPPSERKPTITPIDTAGAAATNAAQDSKLDNSPPNPNYYAQAEQRYASQRVQEHHRRLLEMTASNGKPPSTPGSSAKTPDSNGSKASTPSAHTNGSSNSMSDAVALASLRNMPAGSLPHSPNLTHMPFTPPSKRPDIEELVRDNDDPALIRHRRNSSLSKSLLTKPRSAYVNIPKFSESKPPIPLLHQDRDGVSTTPLGSPGLAASPLLQSSGHFHPPLSYSAFENSRDGAAIYPGNEQYNGGLMGGPGPAVPNRFDDFIRQLNAQSTSNTAAPHINGTSAVNGIPPLPAISAEQMDFLRDAIVFTPPPEAQKAHLAKLATARAHTPNGQKTNGQQSQTNGSKTSPNQANDSPERPAWSPLSDDGRR